MQWLWILPSLGYGVYTFVATGQVYGLVFGALSLAAMLAGSLLQRRQQPVDPSGQVRFGAGRVAIGNRVLPKWQWRWQAAWVELVYSQLEESNAQLAGRLAVVARLRGRLSASEEQLQAPAGLPAWLGFAGTSQIELNLAREGGHGIVVGATGAGKSQLLTLWLVSLCQGLDAGRLRLVLVDFKGGATLAPFAKTPQTQSLHTDLGEPIHQVLGQLQALLTEREQALAELAVAEIALLPASKRPPTVLVVIDELQALLTENPATQPALEAIAARGRSLGVHLLVTAQSLIGIPRGLLANLGVRIAVGRSDSVDLAQLGYSRPPAALGGAAAGAMPAPGATPAGSLPNTEAKVNSAAEIAWGQAVLITPERQLRFGFPSGGAVHPARALEAKETLINFGF